MPAVHVPQPAARAYQPSSAAAGWETEIPAERAGRGRRGKQNARSIEFECHFPFRISANAPELSVDVSTRSDFSCRFPFLPLSLSVVLSLVPLLCFGPERFPIQHIQKRCKSITPTTETQAANGESARTRRGRLCLCIAEAVADCVSVDLFITTQSKNCNAEIADSASD